MVCTQENNLPPSQQNNAVLFRIEQFVFHFCVSFFEVFESVTRASENYCAPQARKISNLEGFPKKSCIQS